MNEEDLAYAGVRQQARLVATGEVSSAELVDLSLRRIAAAQPALSAFRVVRDEEARAEAQEADARRAAGDTSPLLGVPIAVKDDVNVTGLSTHFGCDGDFPEQTEDSEIVRRLRKAGAIIVGKTHAPELGQWPVTEGSWFEPTRNPWSLEHTPGGSSGGSAAAVAAGLVAGAIGSDGAGSVRIPAAWTGLVGLKPQRGRLSTWPEAEAFYGLTSFGPLTRTVGDTALMLDAISGNHAGDRHTPPSPAVSYLEAASRPPRRLRIALSFRAPYAVIPMKVEDEVVEMTRRTATLLRDLGHEVVERDPSYPLIALSHLPRGAAGIYEWADRIPDLSKLDHRTQANMRSGRMTAGPIASAARALEAIFRRTASRIFSDVDLLLMPTTATPALPIGALDGRSSWETDKISIGSCPYCYAWNALGWPALTVPAGNTAAGLPIGSQLLGLANSEPLLLSVAGELEVVERWQDRRPPVRAALTV